MFKKIFTYLILIFLSICNGYTQPVNKKLMQKAGLNFYNFITDNNYNKKNIKIQKYHYYQNTLTYSTIVFKNNDWVIVSSDKRADPVLAYSDEHSYSEFTPPNVSFWLEQYDLYIYEVKNKNYIDEENINYNEVWKDLLDNNLLKYKQTRGVVVSPLISTKWGQSQSNTGNDPYAYNYYAPPGDICEHTVAGQIIKYQQCPNCDIFDWSKMPNTLDANEPNYIQYKKEIANLLRNLGDKMQIYMGSSHNYYGCDESGTNSVEAILVPLKNDFYYSTAVVKNRSNYGINEWKDILCNELESDRPILYTGYKYSNNTRGHAFVCDGYEKPLLGKRFHFNFGWNGDDDGYYRINYNDLLYNNLPYKYSQKAIIYLSPSINCESFLTIYQQYKYSPYFSPDYNNFYNPVAGTIISSPLPITIANGDVVHYRAYNEIVLENFETEDGADFTAEIIPCPLICNFTNYKNRTKSYQYFSGFNQNSITNKDITNSSNLMNIYPNPSKDVFYIHFNSNNVSGKIIIFNYLGNTILNKELTKNDFEIDLSDYPSGIYLVKFISNSIIYNHKIIKQ
jgi:hypothetical protein